MRRGDHHREPAGRRHDDLGLGRGDASLRERREPRLRQGRADVEREALEDRVRGGPRAELEGLPLRRALGPIERQVDHAGEEMAAVVVQVRVRPEGDHDSAPLAQERSKPRLGIARQGGDVLEHHHVIAAVIQAEQRGRSSGLDHVAARPILRGIQRERGEARRGSPLPGFHDAEHAEPPRRAEHGVAPVVSGQRVHVRLDHHGRLALRVGGGGHFRPARAPVDRKRGPPRLVGQERDVAAADERVLATRAHREPLRRRVPVIRELRAHLQPLALRPRSKLGIQVLDRVIGNARLDDREEVDPHARPVQQRKFVARLAGEVRRLEIADHVELARAKGASTQESPRTLEGRGRIPGKPRGAELPHRALETEPVARSVGEGRVRPGRRGDRDLVPHPRRVHDGEPPLPRAVDPGAGLLVPRAHALGVVEHHGHRRGGAHGRALRLDGGTRERADDQNQRERAQDEEQDLAQAESSYFAGLERAQEHHGWKLDLGEPPPAQEMDQDRDRSERQRPQERGVQERKGGHRALAQRSRARLERYSRSARS